MMKRISLLLLCCTALLAASCHRQACQATRDPVDLVNPLTGTASTYQLSTGNTYPAIAMPWGMNFWTPQTGRNGDGWTYTYTANKIRGLKQTHQPSPWINDYGSFSLMPVTTGPFYDEEGRQSWFSHKAETAKPYYYKVYLADHDVTAELAPTERAAAFRLTYPQKDTSYLVVDAYEGGAVEVFRDRNMIAGCSTVNHGGAAEGFRNWFVVVSDTPFETVSIDGSIAMVGFRTVKGQEVNLRVASSFIGQEQAELNLGELGGRTLDEVAEAGKARWNEVLGRIKVEDPDIDNLRTFYSCLYRSLLFPRDLSETDASGDRVHRSPFDGEVHKGYLFADTGFWDTFRSLFPLLDLVYPDQEAKMQEGLVNTWRESGFLPEWASPGHRGCMVGNNSASVVAGAYIKGLRGYDAEELWKAVTHGAHAVHPGISSTGRLGWDYYDSLGYVPCDVGIRESAARTLEYAYDDWCIYSFGKALGKSEEELAPYAKAALNYRNLFDPSLGFARPKYRDGRWKPDFDVRQTYGEGFIEGNSWNFSFHVPQDVYGNIAAMGGEKEYVRKLDVLFGEDLPEIYYADNEDITAECLIGGYVHGNEPSHHIPYLYAWTSQPWKTQYWLREVMNSKYRNDIRGLGGNDDCGQMSAWYIFTALGFYPVCPGTDQYVLGAPYLPYLKLDLPNGKTFEVKAPAVSDKNRYVKEVRLNGVPYSKLYITHADILNGGTLEFVMAAKPNKKRGLKAADKPYSLTN